MSSRTTTIILSFILELIFPVISLKADPGDITIYTDTTTTITSIWTGHGTLTEETGDAYEGTEHYHYSYSIQDWFDGVRFGLDGMDVSRADALELAFKGPGTDHELYVRFDDMSGIKESNISVGQSTDYTVVQVPIADLDSANVDLTQVKHLQISVGGAETGTGDFYVDSIKLIGVAPNAPVADFTVDTTSGSAPLLVNFTDTSTQSPISWSWDFDNDGIVDSTEQNPQHTYTAIGTYTVKLTASNAEGGDSEIKTDLITVNPAGSDTNIYTDEESAITDTWTSYGTLTELSGGAYEGTNHYHYSYSLQDWFDGVRFGLNGMDVSGADYLELAFKGPAAGYDLRVRFDDMSGIKGNNISVGQSADYTVVQVPIADLDNASVDLTQVKHLQISVAGAETGTGDFYVDSIKLIGVAPNAPVADFTVDTTSGSTPLLVNFTDTSTQSPISWSWDFDNDGIVDSTEQNPQHTYTAIGTYTVKLTASNAEGGDSEIKTDLITVNPSGSDTIVYTDEETIISTTTISYGTLTEEAGAAYEGTMHYHYSYDMNGWFDGFRLLLGQDGMDVSEADSLELAFKGPAAGHQLYKGVEKYPCIGQFQLSEMPNKHFFSFVSVTAS